MNENSSSFSSRKIRRRTTPEQRLEYVRRYLRSGLTQAEFVRQHGFSLPTLSNWLQQARSSGSIREGQHRSFPPSPPKLQEFPLSSVLPASPWAAELRGPSGRVLSVRAELPAPLLTLLLRRL